MMWTKEKVLQLIELLHKSPALWNMHCKEYRDRNLKAGEVKKIASHFNISEDEAIKKIKSLKTQFRRQHNKVLKEKSVADVNSASKEWFGYNVLMFLKENNMSNNGHSNMEKNTDDDDDDDGRSISSFDAEDTPSDSSEKDQRCTQNSPLLPDPNNTRSTFQMPLVQANVMKKKSNINQVDQAYNTTMHTTRETRLGRDVHSVYGENVASRMRNAGRNRRALAIARNQIDNVLFSLEMGYFDENLQEMPSLHTTSNHNSSSFYPSTRSSSKPLGVPAGNSKTSKT